MDHSLDHEIVSDSDRAESPLTQAALAAVDDGSVAPASWAFPTSSHTSQPAAGRARIYWVWAVCGFLLLAVGLVFAQTLRFDFIGFDDPEYVFENPHVTAGLTLSGLWWALTDGPLNEWCPLTVISHALDCQLYGLKPAGHHLTNVLLHAASSVFLFLVLLRMTGVLWPSAWVAAVFAIHPLHTESVAWIAERRDMLSGLFFMLTLGAYALYAERPSPLRYLAVAGCFALGLMSKPMLVTVPCVLLLLDYWPLERLRGAAGAASPIESGSWFSRLPVGWRLVAEKIPLMAMAAVSCKVAMSFHFHDSSTVPVDQVSLTARLANALVSYAAYLGQSFFPVDMAVFYPLRAHVPLASAVEAFVLLVVITAVALFGWRRRPYVLVGWLWFLGMLVPVLGLVSLGYHARADRYTYLSQIGLTIALSWSVWSVYERGQSRQAAGRRPWLLAAVSGATVIMLTAVAWRQAAYWRNSETLFTHALDCTEQNAMAHFNVALCCTQQGRTEEAITHLRAALEAGSVKLMTIVRCHYLLGDCLASRGNTDEALAEYEEAVRLFPSGTVGHFRLASALSAAGRHDQAIVEWREIVRLAPTHWPARAGLASALLVGGDASEAAAECREVLKQEPNAVEAIAILGTALATEGHAEEALPHLQRGVELDPRNARAHLQLGLILHDRGRLQSARNHLDMAIRLAPDDASMLWQVAWILATSPDASFRDGPEAVELATKAVERSNGQDVRAFDALAAALAESGKFPAAVDVADQASTIALTRGNEALADAIEQRMRLYRQGLPYRQSSPLPAEHAPAE